jgi:hypothetical protein
VFVCLGGRKRVTGSNTFTTTHIDYGNTFRSTGERAVAAGLPTSGLDRPHGLQPPISGGWTVVAPNNRGTVPDVENER